VTAITVDFGSGPPVVVISEDEALDLLVSGDADGAYKLPDGVLRAVTGRAALRERAGQVHAALNAASETLDGAADRLALRLALAVTSAGAIPKGSEPGAAILALEADLARLKHEDRIFAGAVDKSEGFPVTITRQNGAAVGAALDDGLTALLAAAWPHAAKVAALEDGADNLRAVRVDSAGFDALERLAPRLLALETAGQAMARLGAPWQGPADDGAAPAIRLARLARLAETP
jgi:hypothetical protein